jgi:hypothetical protein
MTTPTTPACAPHDRCDLCVHPKAGHGIAGCNAGGCFCCLAGGSRELAAKLSPAPSPRYEGSAPEPQPNAAFNLAHGLNADGSAAPPPAPTRDGTTLTEETINAIWAFLHVLKQRTGALDDDDRAEAARLFAAFDRWVSACVDCGEPIHDHHAAWIGGEFRPVCPAPRAETGRPQRREKIRAEDESIDAPDGAALEFDGGRGWYVRSGSWWVPCSEEEGRRYQAEALDPRAETGREEAP